jgi:RND superfamily putative drug exporter
VWEIQEAEPVIPSESASAVHEEVAVLTRLTSTVLARPRLVVVASLLATLVAAPMSVGLEKRLNAGGFFAPSDESTIAATQLDAHFPAGPANLVVQVFPPQGTSIDDPAVRQAGERIASRLESEPGVDSVISYWDLRARPGTLSARDGSSALIASRIRGDEVEVKQRMLKLYPSYAGVQEGLTVRLGGQPPAEREIAEQSRHDLTRAELVAAPILMLLLVLVFGSVVAAALPLIVAAVSVVGAMAVLALISAATDVSVFSLNLATALGLGLAIDYSLFILTRFREELGLGADVREAVATSMRTAGRTVMVSGLTVALCLASTLVFPLYYFRSFAYAGVAVVGLAVLVSLTLLPAVLLMLGHRTNSLDVLKRLRGRHRSTAPGAGWERLARRVMARPLPWAAAVVVLLVTFAAPFAGARFAMPDDRILPESSESHQVLQALRDDYPVGTGDVIPVVAAQVQLDATKLADLSSYAQALSQVSVVERVEAATGVFQQGVRVEAAGPASAAHLNPEGGTWLAVVPAADAYSAQAEQLVQQLREVPAPFPVAVGGLSAHFLDTKKTIGESLPLAVALIGLTTFVLLFLFTGSVVVPLKALMLNLLSLTATFGAMVWVFQEGRLQWLLGDFQVSGLLEITTPMLMFFIAFGLSMDYEVFLLSRIKEEWDRTGDNEHAVAVGLARTGRLVTSAALLMVVVLLSFATSGISILKMLGVGLALAVIVDATLVRAILVPAFMKMLGDRNWWSPRVLQRVYAGVGQVERDHAPVAPLPLPQAAAAQLVPLQEPVPAPDSAAARLSSLCALHAVVLIAGITVLMIQS